MRKGGPWVISVSSKLKRGKVVLRPYKDRGGEGLTGILMSTYIILFSIPMTMVKLGAGLSIHSFPCSHIPSVLM